MGRWVWLVGVLLVLLLAGVLLTRAIDGDAQDQEYNGVAPAEAPEAQASCANLGKPCTKPNTSNPPCCAPNVCDPVKFTCQAPGTTTTSSGGGTSTTAGPTTTTSTGASTTTTTSSTPTTTTPPAPPNAGYSFLYTPADLGLLLTKFGASCQFTGDIMDPRTGAPADQFMLTAMAWQFQQYSMEMVAAADAVGCPWNSVQIEDSNFKFGADYWLLHQPFPTSGTYQQLQPTYVRQYTCAPIVATAACLQAKHALATDLAQVAGLMVGPTSAPPIAPPNPITAGILVYDTGHYPPLTPHQCALLQAAEDAHMVHDQSFLDHDFAGAAANNQAVLNAQRAFEGSAETLEQATLFKWTWQGNYNRSNPQEVLDGLTRGIMAAHQRQTAAFNCGTGQPPDAGKILHYRFQHNFWHDCRATTHWLDVAMPTVCDSTQIQSCPRKTCRQQAAEL